MEKEKLKKLWNKHGLSCRNSYSPSFIKKICKDFDMEFKEEWIYTRDRYREMSDGSPRIDAEDFMIAIAKHHNIIPKQERLETANKMFGEGSRRQCIEEAYLEA